jgi:3-deoxy-D-manno-octulosonate 8-phosphate phosphatase (KDO 8-P phosphatase)
MRPLDNEEKRKRARRIKLVLVDVDGVLTDGTVEYSVHGEELRRFSVRDGLAVERLRADGVETALLLAEPAPMVLQRARKLHIHQVFPGPGSKADQLPRVLEHAQIAVEELAYLGDDVDDVENLRRVGEAGLAGVPADAAPEASALAHVVTTARGGYGSFREFADLLLDLRRPLPA